jgi:hypothetical protein
LDRIAFASFSCLGGLLSVMDRGAQQFPRASVHGRCVGEAAGEMWANLESNRLRSIAFTIKPGTMRNRQLLSPTPSLVIRGSFVAAADGGMKNGFFILLCYCFYDGKPAPVQTGLSAMMAFSAGTVKFAWRPRTTLGRKSGVK